jgi:hypothetical protein
MNTGAALACDTVSNLQIGTCVRRREQLRLRLISLSAAASLVVMWLVAPGVAAKCNPASVDPNRNNDTTSYYWVGAKQTPGGTVTGVESTIWNYSPYVPNTRFSSAWVMLSKQASYTWAQIGPHEVVSDQRDIHIQTASGTFSSIWDMNTPAQPLNTYTRVDVLYQAVLQSFIFQVNGVNVLVKPLSWVPTNGQFYAEIPSLTTQMMGARTNNENLKLNYIQYGGAWHNLAGTVTSTNSTYFKFSGSSSSFFVWDDTCAS